MFPKTNRVCPIPGPAVMYTRPFCHSLTVHVALFRVRVLAVAELTVFFSKSPASLTDAREYHSFSSEQRIHFNAVKSKYSANALKLTRSRRTSPETGLSF